LLVVVGGLQVYLLYRTLQFVRRQAHEMKQQRIAMRGQLATMQGQLSEMGIQTGILQESIAHAEKSATAAKKSADALSNAERAWLFLEPSPTFSLGIKRLDWRITNRGKTTATISEASLRCQKRTGLENVLPSPPVYKGVTIDLYNVPISPNGQIDVWSSIEGTEGEDGIVSGLTDKDVIDIRDKGSDLVAYGFVRYTDALGDLHESRFCYYYALPWSQFRINLRAPAEYHRCT
jgi:hypothetical protein